MLESLTKRKIRDVVVDRLKSFIIAQKLVPGDRLPTETELANLFGVSRLSIREATKSLEFLGIVESKTGVGLTVGKFDISRVTEHLGFHSAFLNASPIEMIDTRIIIETGALPFVAQRIKKSPKIYDELQSILDRFQTTRDLATWIDLDIEFHRSLLEASGLTPLAAFGELIQIFFQRFRDSIKKAEWKKGIESHQLILDYLNKQQVAEATTELARHIGSHKKRNQS